MNVVLFLIWLLSGAVFPLASASDWIRKVMLVNPMTYGVSALRSLLVNGDTASASAGVERSLTLIFVFGLITLAASFANVQHRRV